MPIAVEGLLQLATYLRTSKSEEPDVARLTDVVERLTRINAGYSRNPDSTRFRDWGPNALEAIRDLRELTDRRTKGPHDGSG